MRPTIPAFLLIGFIMAVTLGGCARIDPKIYAANTPSFAPMEFFNGKTTAKGVLQNRSGQVTRRFIADIVGEIKTDNAGKQFLELREEFRFDDGEIQYRTWILYQTGAHDYTGTAGDVIGTAVGRVHGNAMNLRYVLRVPVGDTTYDINMDDWMYMVDDKTVMNITDMAKFGFAVGRLSLVIYRE